MITGMELLIVIAVCLIAGYSLGHSDRLHGRELRRLGALSYVLYGSARYPVPEIRDIAKLREDLVAAGWRHESSINDPEHYDLDGSYRYWGD